MMFEDPADQPPYDCNDGVPTLMSPAVPRHVVRRHFVGLLAKPCSDGGFHNGGFHKSEEVWIARTA